MAYYQEPLMKATAKQFESIVAARNTTGAHIFYSGGYHTDKKQLQLELPSPLGYRFNFTTIFEYKGDPSSTRSHIFFANKAKKDDHYLRFEFALQYSLLYVLDGKLERVRLMNIKSPVNGLHVLEIKSEVYLQARLDDDFFFNPEDVNADLDALLLFYSAPLGSGSNADFIFWESHFTQDHSFVKFQDKFAFKHESLSIRNGGYALFHGSWRQGTQLELTTGTAKNPIKRTLQSTGETACLLKVYSESFSFAYANERSGVTLEVTRDGVPLDVMFLKPMPDRIIELTIPGADLVENKVNVKKHKDHLRGGYREIQECTSRGRLPQKLSKKRVLWKEEGVYYDSEGVQQGPSATSAVGEQRYSENECHLL
ncbi:uncharacterized protein LOC144103473 [Amblyomma americanum]